MQAERHLSVNLHPFTKNPASKTSKSRGKVTVVWVDSRGDTEHVAQEPGEPRQQETPTTQLCQKGSPPPFSPPCLPPSPLISTHAHGFPSASVC